MFLAWRLVLDLRMIRVDKCSCKSGELRGTHDLGGSNGALEAFDRGALDTSHGAFTSIP